MTGWILIHRRLFDNKTVGAEKPYSRFEAWVWLLLEACRKKEGRSFTLKIGGKERNFHEDYGELTHSQRFMAEAWGWSQKSVQTFLRHLECSEKPMITRKQHHRMTQLSICKFQDYQNPGISKGISRESAGNQHSISTASNYNTLTVKTGEQPHLPEEKLFEQQLTIWHEWRTQKQKKNQEITERFSRAEEELCRQLVKMTGGLSPANLKLIEGKMKIYLEQWDGFWSDRKWPLAGFVQMFNEIDIVKHQPPPPAPEPEEIHSEWCEKDPCTCSPEYLKSKGLWKEGFGMKEVNEMFTRLKKDFKDHGNKP